MLSEMRREEEGKGEGVEGIDAGPQIICRMAGLDPVRDITFLRNVMEVQVADACRHWDRECCLFVGMLAAIVVIVGKDHDIAPGEILLIAGRQTVTAPAERESRQAEAHKRVHVLLTLGPIDELLLLHLKGVTVGEVRNGLKTFRLAVLPAGRGIGVRHAIDRRSWHCRPCA